LFLSPAYVIQHVQTVDVGSAVLSGLSVSINPLRLTWPPTVSCRRKKIVVSCVLPIQGLASSGGPTATLGTDVSRLPVHRPKTLLLSLPAGLRQTDIGYEQFKRICWRLIC